jgi:hypothetical protein
VSVCPLDPVMGMNNIWAAYNLSALWNSKNIVSPKVKQSW